MVAPHNDYEMLDDINLILQPDTCSQFILQIFLEVIRNFHEASHTDPLYFLPSKIIFHNYLIFHSGVRRSVKARGPSFASSLPNTLADNSLANRCEFSGDI